MSRGWHSFAERHGGLRRGAGVQLDVADHSGRSSSQRRWSSCGRSGGGTGRKNRCSRRKTM
ncbi:MAG: hypothetical protein ACLU38_07660 [Dysosmobacter sp.]